MAKKLVRMVTNNFLLKLISVALAVVLWLVVVNIDNPQTTMTFTSTANIINENIISENGKVYEILDNSNTVKFSVTGPRTIVEGMSASDFTVVADMSKIDLDLGLVPVEVIADRYASKVSVSLKTTNVRVSIEDVKTRQFAVATTTSGTPMEGYALGDVSCDPATVTISGPESVIKSIDKVTAGINVEGMYSNRTQTVIPTMYDASGNKIVSASLTLEPATVQVTAQIMGTKSIPVVYEYSGELPDGYVLESATCLPDTILVKGSKDALAKIDSLKIPSDALNLRKETGDVEKTVTISGMLPEGVDLVDADHNNVVVKVEISARGVKELKVPVENIEIKNLSDDYDIVFSTKTVLVKLEGDPDVLKGLSAEDVKLSVDMKGSDTGRFTKTPIMTAINGLTESKIAKVNGTVVVKQKEESEEDDEE